mgnify:CR=1 FL=1
MKTIPAALLTHIGGDQVTTALCWLVEKTTGGYVRGTDHDKNIDVTISTPSAGLVGLYVAHENISGSDLRTSSDLSVDNMEVESAESADSPNDGITFAEVHAGALNGARVTVFMCNWKAPDVGQIIIRRGYLGETTFDSDGRLKLEVRGLSQLLSQQIGKIMSDRCDVVRFGDTRCGYDAVAITGTGTIDSLTSRRVFVMTVPAPPAWTMFPAGGEVTFTSGENAGFTKEVKGVVYAAPLLTITLYEEMPGEVVIGDALEFVPGCDRRYTTCKLYDNLVNFRGFGVFVPGALAIMRGAAIGDCVVQLPDGSIVGDSP